MSGDRHGIPLFLLLTVAAAAAAAGQQVPGPREPPPVTFRVEAESVEVDAVVTDAQGRAVTDLRPGEVEVFEDGRRQAIQAFSLVTLPLERPAAAMAGVATEPDVGVNTAADGRIYLLVLDDLHTSVTNTPRVRAFLRQFLERGFGANDLASVAYTSGRLDASQDFTNNRRLLLEAVDRFTGRRLRSEAAEIAEALNRDPRDPSDTPVNPRSTAGDGRDPFDPYSTLNPFEAERARQARATLRVVRDLAGLMANVRGRRKTMVLVSEGLTYNVFDGFRNTSAGVILGEARQAMAAAMRASVAIYPIDPRGLAGFGDTIDAPATSPDDPHFSVPGTALNLLRLSQQGLRTLAEQTGGFAAIDRNDLAGVFDRLVRENSTYYLLGYAPTNARADGRFRRIEVRVTRPGLQVRARPGYVAEARRVPPAGSSGAARLDAALRSPVPLTGLPMSLAAAPYRVADGDALVVLAIEVRGDQLALARTGDRSAGTLRVALSATGADGVRRGEREHVLDLDLQPRTLAVLRERGLVVVSTMRLPAGRHQVRVAAAEERGTRAGSVFVDLEVPDFRVPGLHLGGVSLTSASALDGVTVRAEDPLNGILLGPPIAARAFAAADVIALLAEAYENGAPGAPQAIAMSARVLAPDGRVAFEHRAERAPAATGGAARYAVQIPLEGIAPGAYLLRVEGRSTRPSGPTVRRDIVIEVR